MCHTLGPTIPLLKITRQYKKVHIKNFTLSVSFYSQADCYCLIQTKLIRIENIVDDSLGTTLIIGKKFTSYEPLYNYPFQSNLLNIYKAKNLSSLKIWNILNVKAKCFVLKLNNDFISFPLLHTL